MNIVLDTCCLFSAMPRYSPDHWILEAFRREEFTLCVTTEILEEYDEILTRRYSATASRVMINELLHAPNVSFITIYYRMRLIRHDPDDDKFSDCAFASGAHYLITHDHHFNVLRPLFFPRINVIKLKDFKQILQEEKK